MAQVVLSAVGQAVGGGFGQTIGSVVGAMADRSLIDSLKPARQAGPRLEALRLTGVAEGAPMAAVFGAARVSGQVIWAARFRERREEGRSGGGKGGPRTVDYQYSLSFAVAVCEGPVDGVGRVWADGALMDTAGVTMRLHRGDAEQEPDSLIEAVEGVAPAYRGTAYVVFEDLPLDAWGDRPPQLSFEVFRRPRGEGPTLEDRLEGVSLIPGAGEFVYAIDTVLRREGIARYEAENIHTGAARADLRVSLDQLQAQLPNLKRVSLVVTWFGDDLRCGSCQIRPGVESLDKATTPWNWRAGGVDRIGARLISGGPEAPAFGGTPADRGVLQAIAELKARGLEVTLYPLLMMDVPAGNGLDDPYGGSEQAAFPWRGRITCHPAAGRVGTSDRTEDGVAQTASFFGVASTADFGVADGLPTYGGPDEWSYRRMVLHYAKLATLAGGVEGFLLGSELRGLTTVRDAAGGYPAVAALRSLAADVRELLGATPAISYGADWSEWFGHQPADGSGDVAFHLDPLWADEAVSYVGIDWYPPLTDWRVGAGGLDAATASGPHDREHLLSRVAGGEAFDWYYADAEARAAQDRTAITDGADDEPWVFRPKDLVGWWGHAHHDRPAGVRSGAVTAWTPGMKPIRFVEFGCPAVDRGANSPNLFIDAKSSESALPIDSDGGRDDLGQRLALEATLAWFATPANNPISAGYGAPMLEAADAWCWDARPFPEFPARADVWADAQNWATGHWLNGRVGGGDAEALVGEVLRRGGVGPDDIDLSNVSGMAAGYVIDRPMRVRDALEPLATTFGLEPCERGGRIAFAAGDGRGATVLALGEVDLAVEGDEAAPQTSRTLERGRDTVTVRFIDLAADYQIGSATTSSDAPEGGGAEHLDLPIVITRGEAERIARRLLASGGREEATASLGPEAAMRLEPGDLVSLTDLAGQWRVEEMRTDERCRAMLRRPSPELGRLDPATDWRATPSLRPAGPAAVEVLDLPPLPGHETDARPVVVATCEPWRALDVWVGADAGSLTPRGRVTAPTPLGVTESALALGPVWRWDLTNAVDVHLQGGALQSRTEREVLAGANTLAVRAPSGEWELLSFLTATLVGEERWRLSGLLRGRQGSEAVMASTPAGAAVVFLGETVTRAEVSVDERGLARLWRLAPAGGPAGGLAASDATAVWRATALRPWSPAHLRARPVPGGDWAFDWLARGWAYGDGLEAEPLGEADRWRVRVLTAAGDAVRETETSATTWTYTAADQVSDFGSAAPGDATAEVARGSALYGWGVTSAVALA